MFERKNDIRKWDGVFWYLLLMLCYSFIGSLTVVMCAGFLVCLLTVYFTSVPKFPTGYHYVNNITLKVITNKK